MSTEKRKRNWQVFVRFELIVGVLHLAARQF
uniref:Uncharacterized protein n=1 Tax=Arundo donax TaxID=35708 RepID=A0A0A9BTC9_ARUDO